MMKYCMHMRAKKMMKLRETHVRANKMIKLKEMHVMAKKMMKLSRVGKKRKMDVMISLDS